MYRNFFILEVPVDVTASGDRIMIDIDRIDWESESPIYPLIKHHDNGIIERWGSEKIPSAEELALHPF